MGRRFGTGTRISLGIALLAAGCGTTRTSDTSRTATEQLLVSSAIDQTVSRLDFRLLADRKVFFDPQYLDGTVDKGYLISSIRQHLLAHGALLQEERENSLYVVEPRSGAIGTDKNSLLVGTPALSLPALVPGIPTSIPEIALVKNTDQKGVAKIAVFAYNRVTGRALWQSGTRDWHRVRGSLGAGPTGRRPHPRNGNDGGAPRRHGRRARSGDR